MTSHVFSFFHPQAFDLCPSFPLSLLPPTRFAYFNFHFKFVTFRSSRYPQFEEAVSWKMRRISTMFWPLFPVQMIQVTSLKVGRSRSRQACSPGRLHAYMEMDFSASRIGNESQFFLLSPSFLSVFVLKHVYSSRCFSRSYCGLSRCLSNRDGSDDVNVILCSQEFGVCLPGWKINSMGWIHHKQGGCPLRTC